MIELQPGNPFTVGEDSGLAELPELAAINEGFQNVLLDIVIVVDDGRKLGSKFGQVFDGFVDGVIVDIVGGGFGTQQEMIADVLFDEAMAIMTADDGIG